MNQIPSLLLIAVNGTMMMLEIVPLFAVGRNGAPIPVQIDGNIFVKLAYDVRQSLMFLWKFSTGIFAE